MTFVRNSYHLVSLWIILSSCTDHFQEKELYGYYSPVNYINTYDTFQLKPLGMWQRKIYDSNKKLLLNNEGKWKIERSGKVTINNFILNYDVDLVKFPETVEDSGYALTPSFEIESGAIQFCSGHLQGENCYRKIK